VADLVEAALDPSRRDFPSNLSLSLSERSLHVSLG
jgi:hypothetical protein